MVDGEVSIHNAISLSFLNFCAGSSLLRGFLELGCSGLLTVAAPRCGAQASLVAACRLTTASLVAVIVAHGLCYSSGCGITLIQGSNLCPLHWQADSYPLYHQGSPTITF